MGFGWWLLTSGLLFHYIIVLLYLMAKRLTTRGIIILVLTIAGMILFTDQTTNLFKFTFERLRPCAQEGVLELIRQGDCWGLWLLSRGIRPIQWQRQFLQA